MGRRAVVVVLIAVLAAPGTLVRAAAAEAVVAGAVTLDARPLAGARIAFIELATGAVSRTVTGADGSYRASLPAGSYAVVAAEGRPDLALRRAPARLTLPPGGRATADLELQAVPGTAPPAQPSARPVPSASRANRPLIEHQAVGCFVVRQCAQVQAHIRATPGVSRARGYFRSANSPWYSVDMERVPPAGGTGDTFVATLPGARDPGPLTYYLSAVAADGSEERSPEIVAQVVTSAGLVKVWPGWQINDNSCADSSGLSQLT